MGIVLSRVSLVSNLAHPLMLRKWISLTFVLKMRLRVTRSLLMIFKVSYAICTSGLTVLMMHVANSIKLRNSHDSQNHKCSTLFDFKVDDMVSYQGRAVTIVDLIDPCSSGFMNARIRRVDHDGAQEKQVKYADLLPLGTLFPEKMLPATVPVQVDQFYFFDASSPDGSVSSKVRAGKLLHYDANLEMCTIQQYESNAINVRHYQPTWISPKGVICSRTPAKAFSPNTINVHQSSLLLQSPINKSGNIPAQSLHSLTSRGIDMSK